MNKKIRVTISKEDTYDFQDLVEELTEDPKVAFDICELHGSEGFTLDSFTNYESLEDEDKDKIITDLAIAKSEADANLSEDQDEKFELFLDIFDEED